MNSTSKITLSTTAVGGDLTQCCAIDSEAMDWEASPGGEVLRKRLHRVGPAEAGQVTSLVRYPARSQFPRHAHPDGEEILVLEGVFSDEHGDWPAGTFLLNPQGFEHAPFSKEGCLLFVKLRQSPGGDRQHVVIDTQTANWRSSVRRAVEWKKLYAQEAYGDHMRLERWCEPSDVGQLNFPHGAELLVVDGSFVADGQRFGRHTWLRLAAGSSLTPEGSDACELYIKEGGFAYLLTA